MAAVQTFTRAEETALFRLICTGALSDKPAAQTSVDGGTGAAASAASSVGAGSSSSSSFAGPSLGASDSAASDLHPTSAVWQYTIRDRGRIFAIAPTSLFQHHHSAEPSVASSATGGINAASPLEFEVAISPGGYPLRISPRAIASAIASNGDGVLIDTFITVYKRPAAPHPRKATGEDAINPHTAVVDERDLSLLASSSASGAGFSASAATADDSLLNHSEVWLMMYRLDNASSDAAAEFIASYWIPSSYLPLNDHSHVCAECGMSRLLDGTQHIDELAPNSAWMGSFSDGRHRCSRCLSQRPIADSQTNPTFALDGHTGGMCKDTAVFFLF